MHPLSPFSTKYWDIIGDNIVVEVHKTFETESLDSSWNQTFISLIPKNSFPTSVNHFRPTSLCNVTYKIISRLLIKD